MYGIDSRNKVICEIGFGASLDNLGLGKNIIFVIKMESCSK
jgi:hypothetical protein